MAYGPYYPEHGRLLNTPLDPQRVAPRAHIDTNRLRSFMSRFTSVSLFATPSDDYLSPVEHMTRVCSNQSCHISVPYSAAIVTSISTLPGPCAV